MEDDKKKNRWIPGFIGPGVRMKSNVPCCFGYGKQSKKFLKKKKKKK